MAEAVSAISGITGLISGLSGNKQGRAMKSKGSANMDAASQAFMQALSAMLRNAQRGGQVLNADVQFAKSDAARQRHADSQMQAGVGSLVAAGHNPGDSVYERLASAGQRQTTIDRDLLRVGIDQQNLLAQQQLWQMTGPMASGLMGAGQNMYGMGQSQIQNPAGLLSSGFVSSLGKLIGGGSSGGGGGQADNTQYGNYW